MKIGKNIQHLREEIIQAWQQVNPEVAKLYSNSNSGKPDLTADGMPVNSDHYLIALCLKKRLRNLWNLQSGAAML